jgi:hypothetical protein
MEAPGMIRTKPLMVLGLALGLLPLADRAMAAGPYDGVYAGTQRVTKTNNSSQCSNINQDNIRVMVLDNTFRYKWGPVPMQVTVAGDGSFSLEVAGAQSRATSSSVSMKGKINIGNLEGDVGGNICAAHISLRKQ